MNSIKNIWKEIKSIITITNLSSDIQKSLSYSGPTITNKVEFQISLTIILQQLLKKQKKTSSPHTNIYLVSLKTELKTPFF